MGSLPGEADGDYISRRGDIFEVFDNLQGVAIPALKIEKCDTDRNLYCLPADLLMVVDLLNGADAFTGVNGDTLPQLVPSCPNMRLPP